MVFYKSCLKCRGDMHIRKDVYGDFRECIQCGLLQDIYEHPTSQLVSSSTGSDDTSTSPQGSKGKRVEQPSFFI